MATTSSTTEAATAHATATTANGHLATANAKATGTTGSDDSTAVTQGDGIVTTMSAFAKAPVAARQRRWPRAIATISWVRPGSTAPIIIPGHLEK
jgi:hypothetical protein